MSDSNKTPEELINQIINYLENEREIYGDYSLPSSSGDMKSQPDTKPADKPGTEPPSNSKINSVAEPSQEHPRSASPATDTKIDSQEHLSNQGDAKDIYSQINGCNTLEELEALCKKAEVLKTDLEGTQLVFGVGNADADLMLIGEAPGAEEDRLGEPFVGKAGQLLNKILKAIDLKREDVYIANILKHRPPNNRNPKEEERKRSLPFLLRQIDLVNPKLILALGKVSAQTLLDSDRSLSKMRGTFHKFRGNYELLATYHPAALLRHPKWKRPTWEDVQRLRERYDELGCKP